MHIRAVFTWLSKGIGFGFGFGFTTPFGWLVYLLRFWFYDSQVKTALIKLLLAYFFHTQNTQRANLNSTYVMFLHFRPRYSIPWAALVVSVPFLSALVVQVFLFLILVVLEFLALLFAVSFALWFLFLALQVLFSLALKFPFSLVSEILVFLPSVAFPVFF